MRKRSIPGKIRNIVKQHRKIDYWYSCYKKRNNLEFQDYARDKSYTTVTIKAGIENIDVNSCNNILYYVKSGNSFSGFGAEFRRTLDALFFADYYSFIPVVEYNHKYVYAENVSINGTCNPFEYYFQQPGAVGVHEISKNKFVVFKEAHRELVKVLCHSISSYEQSEEYVKEMGRIIKKYIKLKPEVKRYINESLERIGLDHRHTVGVHYRGTDYHIGYKGHPDVINVDDYFVSLDSILHELPKNTRIFLATDENGIINKFVERYGNRVAFFNDTFRSIDGAPIHFSENSRKHHKYTLGLEILRDIITLSKCDYLIAGLSQVSYCARFFKYSQNKEYAEKIILNNGVK